ncbi:hypothetical protein M4I33_09380 [Clostridium sp. LY3-2]|uniref:hypothetical protein n=1 Tax=Clostridium sp. LY3-2 TaxID=2942482 RepID=UPI0021536830|nr:hypothetical protein [Clostridium sp. LY3-2]MCR6515077.1 hypothetical protein [Clostridium sp. LY3-2]
MKNKMKCFKCDSTKVKKVKALPVKAREGFKTKLLNPNYYICLDCGYSEVWFESKEELDFLLK